MDQVWGMDAVMKNKSTTIYGNIVAFDESAVKEDLIYAGTDDGLIHVSANAGANWNKIDGVTGVPANTYVNMLLASQHNENTVYAAFNNHKNGDFKPYLFKSTDQGKSWTSIASNLPERGSVYSIAEDHQNKDLLFAGTEFGVFFSVDGGKEWTKLTAGIPTIAARDLAIQKRENDLVVGSFGRGFYVLDNYAPLREMTPELLNKQAHLFQIKKGLMYIPTSPLGLSGKSAQGASYFTTPNPTYGVTFTYFVKDKVKTLKEARQAREKKLREDKQAVPYPTPSEMRAEDEEEKPFLLFVVKDADGNTIRKIKTGQKTGINRHAWNMRLATTSPIKLKQSKAGRYSMKDDGPLALPGKYTVELHRYHNGKFTLLNEAVPFEIEHLNNQTLGAPDKKALLAFQNKVAELRRSVNGTSKMISETDTRLKHLKQAIFEYPSAPLELSQMANDIRVKLNAQKIKLWGDGSLSSRDFETAPSISGRVGTIVYQIWNSTTAPTQTQIDGLAIAQKAYTPFLVELKATIKLVDDLQKKLDDKTIPYTPQRSGDWKDE